MYISEPFKVEPKISSEAKKDVATTDDILLKLIENYNLLLDDVDWYVQVFINRTEELTFKTEIKILQGSNFDM